MGEGPARRAQMRRRVLMKARPRRILTIPSLGTNDDSDPVGGRTVPARSARQAAICKQRHHRDAEGTHVNTEAAKVRGKARIWTVVSAV